jgi:uncharacterized protein YkwD
VSCSIGRSRRHVALALLLAAVLVWSGIATSPAHAGTGLRGEMFQLTNDDRADRDRRKLDLDTELSRFARRHSQAMAEAGEVFHTERLVAKLKDKDWSAAGENVGVGPSLSGIEAAFMGSTPHRQNILNREYQDVAVGVVESDGNFWVTVIFYG